MKKNLLLLLFSTLLTTYTFGIELKHSATLNQVLEHMDLYKITKSGFHEGNLLQHSLWTCKALCQWFDEEHEWVKGLDKYKLISILAALLHDIGKAGDGCYFYKHKPNHPHNGFSLLMGKKKFYLENGKQLNISNIFRELNMSKSEQAVLGIMVAMHWEFGLIMKNLEANPHTTLEQECIEYLNKLRFFCKQANFNKGIPTALLIRATIAVSAADVRGIQPHTYDNYILSKLLNKQFRKCYNRASYTGINGYLLFDFEQKGLLIRKKILSLL